MGYPALRLLCSHIKFTLSLAIEHCWRGRSHFNRDSDCLLFADLFPYHRVDPPTSRLLAAGFRDSTTKLQTLLSFGCLDDVGVRLGLRCHIPSLTGTTLLNEKNTKTFGPAPSKNNLFIVFSWIPTTVLSIDEMSTAFIIKHLLINGMFYKYSLLDPVVSQRGFTLTVVLSYSHLPVYLLFC